MVLNLPYPSLLREGMSAFIAATGLLAGEAGVPKDKVQTIQKGLEAFVSSQDTTVQPEALRNQHADLHRALTQATYTSSTKYFQPNSERISALIVLGEKDTLRELIQRIDLDFSTKDLALAIKFRHSDLLELLGSKLRPNTNLEAGIEFKLGELGNLNLAYLGSEGRVDLTQIALEHLDLVALKFLKDKGVNLESQFGCNRGFGQMRFIGPSQETIHRLSRAIGAQLDDLTDINYQEKLANTLNVLEFMKQYNFSVQGIFLDYLLVYGFKDAKNELQTKMVLDLLQGVEERGLLTDYSTVGKSTEGSGKFLQGLISGSSKAVLKIPGQSQLLDFLRSKVAA